MKPDIYIRLEKNSLVVSERHSIRLQGGVFAPVVWLEPLPIALLPAQGFRRPMTGDERKI